jgi:hypothetical protein
VVTTSAAIAGHHDTKHPVLSRVVAWLYTGPVGHLVAGVADWATLFVGALTRGQTPGALPADDAVDPPTEKD